MSKRFTATEKWSDKWYRNLSPTLKLGWLYLTDNCDSSGVIELDRELANFTIGCEVDWDSMLTIATKGRLEALRNGRWWLVKFCDFQYGMLKDSAPPHRAVLKLLEKHGLKERVLKGYRSPINRAKEKEKDKDKDKDSLEGGAGETLFESFWMSFPSGRKKSKAPARKAWAEAIQKASPESIIEAASEYAASREGRGAYVKMPSTWLNQECWSDDREAWNLSEKSARPELTAADLGLEDENGQA